MEQSIRFVIYKKQIDTGIEEILDIREYEFERWVLKSGHFSAGLNSWLMEMYKLVAEGKIRMSIEGTDYDTGGH